MNLPPLFRLSLLTGLSCVIFLHGLTAQEVDLERGAKLVSAVVGGVRLHLVVFHESEFLIRVQANADPKSVKSLNEWGRSLHAVAVCNGGYFELEKLQPSGLEIVDGNWQGGFLNRGDGGSILVRDGKASLVWDTEFQDSPHITAMVQCSPWLVSEGRAWVPPRPSGTDPKNMRTFILTDGSGRWAIGVARSAGLAELARILAAPGLIPGLAVKRALNLDGGPSTGLWVRLPNASERFLKPGWTVRNGVAVVPR